MTRRDPRAPLVFDTLEVGRRAGAMVTAARTVEAPDDFGTDVMRVPAGSPLDLQVRLESVLEGVLVTGEVRATATGSCVRCLETVTFEVVAPFQELFLWDDRAAHHRQVGADDQEDYRIEDDLIDLEPVVRDAIVTALPFQPVCRPDCPGLCDQCGIQLSTEPDHAHEMIDPRWSALASLASPADPNEKRN